jgi:putative endopeptidase
MMKRYASLFLIATAWLVAASPKPSATIIQRAWMDATVKPCDNFFQYANGTWMKNFPISGDKPLWGAPLEMEARNQEVLKGILEEASSRANWQKESLRQQVGDFYASGMDIAAIERKGLKPLASAFAAIEGLRTPADLAGVLASLHMEGSAPGFGFGIDIDDKQNSRFIPLLVQADLSLRDRDSYHSQTISQKKQNTHDQIRLLEAAVGVTPNSHR